MEAVTVIGVGLIGGSFVTDIKEVFPSVHVSGIDARASHLKMALDLGIIDSEGTYEQLKHQDLVIIAVPVDVALAVLPKVLDKVGLKTLVMDMGSTKEKICAAVTTHKNRRHFLACHPIAGTEFSGPQAAIKGLFKGKTNIICEVEKTTFALQEIALSILQKIGMRIRYMDPVSHDRHIAYVSHLSHISSFMLGQTVLDEEKNERDIFDMAGSGFASTVRLAKSSPATWTAIFKDNQDNIIESLDGYIANLQHFRSLMSNEKYDEVFETMKSTNHIKTILKGIE